MNPGTLGKRIGGTESGWIKSRAVDYFCNSCFETNDPAEESKGMNLWITKE